MKFVFVRADEALNGHHWDWKRTHNHKIKIGDSAYSDMTCLMNVPIATLINELRRIIKEQDAVIK